MSEKEPVDGGKAKRFETGRLFVAGVMGAAFAAALTIAGSAAENELARKALLALVASLPLLGVHFVVTAPGHEKQYNVSRLMRLMPVLGLVSAAAGLAMLFENAVKGAGFVFAAFTILCAVVCDSANGRRRRLANGGQHFSSAP